MVVAFMAFMAVVAIADTYVAARHHGGDGVLVDHLADLVAQQHHELVERLDRSLQLDAIDQVDGHRHPLTPQRIQKWILQRLPLGHFLFSPRHEQTREKTPAAPRPNMTGC